MTLLATILDCYGEDYPELFLDVHGDIRVDVAVRLGETAARVVDGQLSLWELSEVFEEWIGITITFMDGYGLNDLMDLWFEGGASSELGQEEEWPGPCLKTFFDALVDEMARYVSWQKDGRVGDLGSQATGTAVAKVTIWESSEGPTTRCGRVLRERRLKSPKCSGDGVSATIHASRMASILDEHGADYSVRFLDENGDIRGAVAVRLGAAAARAANGELTLRGMSEECEGWMALAIAFMDEYSCDRLFHLWWDGALSEFERYPEIPGPALKGFFDALVVEVARYLGWVFKGRVGCFGPDWGE